MKVQAVETRRTNTSFIVRRSTGQLSFFVRPGFFEDSSGFPSLGCFPLQTCPERLTHCATTCAEEVRRIERAGGRSESFQFFDCPHFAGMFSQTLREEPCASYPSLSSEKWVCCTHCVCVCCTCRTQCLRQVSRDCRRNATEQIRRSELEKVFSFTGVKVLIPHCENTPLQVTTRHWKCYSKRWFVSSFGGIFCCSL